MSMELIFRRYWGDTAQLPLPLRNPNTGAPFDPAGAHLIFTLKARAEDPDTAALVQKSSAIGGFPALALGRATVELVPADWSKLSIGCAYPFDVQAQRASDGAVLTVARGALVPEQDITRGTALAIPTVTRNPDLALALGTMPLCSALVAEGVASSSWVHFGPLGIVPAHAGLGLPAHGFVRAATAAGELVAVYAAGALNGLSGLVPGATYYLSDTLPGQLSATPPAEPALVQPLGVASAADTLIAAIGAPIFRIQSAT